MQLWTNKQFKWLLLSPPIMLAIGLHSAQAASRYVYIHSDMLGSPMAITDERGNIISRENVTPYGDSLGKRDSTNGIAVGSPEHGLGYTGHVRDSDLGLTYMQARYYDPVVGRFMGTDPVGFLDKRDPAYFNRYAYAGNNPYRYVDPDGRQAIGLQNIIRRKIASAFHNEAKSTAATVAAAASRENIHSGLSSTSDYATGLTVGALALAQPEIALPAAVVAAATGYAAAALDPEPVKAITTEVVAQITGAKVVKVIGSIASGIAKKNASNLLDDTGILDSGGGANDGWSPGDALESISTTAYERTFKGLAEAEPQSDSDNIGP